MLPVPSTPFEAAIAYAKLGWAVFPVARDKTPLTPNGFKDATLNEKLIAQWWKKHPTAGIGIATGKLSGIVVLDVDLEKTGADSAMKSLISQFGSFPEDIVARTGGGGYHFYFKHPGEDIVVPNAQRLFGLVGIDVRGDGGYVVAPPSGHQSGNFYEWGNGQSPLDSTLPDCPEFLFLSRDPGTTLRLQFDTTIPDGQRNSTLAAIAGLLRSLGMEEDTILRILIEQNETRCNPPLEQAEVETIAHQISLYPPRPNRSSSTRTGQVAFDELLRFDQSDVGYSSLFSFYFTGRIRYNFSQGSWLLWRNHFWETDDRQEIVEWVRILLRDYAHAVSQITDDDARVAAAKWYRQLCSKSRIDHALALASSLPGIASVHRDWDRDAELLATDSGVLNLRTGELRDGLPTDFISRRARLRYDAQATCPTWEAFLQDIFDGDQNVVTFVQRAIGYSLTGETAEQCLFLLVGRGSNGKSVFLSTLLKIIGDAGFSAPFSTFARTTGASTNTNDVAALANKRFVVASEVNEGTSLDEARLKSLTGGETVSARFLHQEFFQFEPVCKIWLGVNHLPRVHDDTDGFWRRVRKIDFPIQFRDDPAGKNERARDPFIADRLSAELPGILAWAVRGAVAWYQIGLPVPETVVESTAEFRRDSDPIADFLSECCSVEDPTVSTSGDRLYRAYLTWAGRKLMKHYEILSLTRFHNRLGREYPRDPAFDDRRYLGLLLREASETVAPSVGSIRIVSRSSSAS